MRQFRIGEITESVVERSDYPPARIERVLGSERIAVLGYGVQGRAQSLNLRDGGLRVVVGVRPDGAGWRLAIQDGWIPEQSLFTLEAAAARGTVILYLLSDAGQMVQWPAIRPHLSAKKALVFAHGFALVYRDQTGLVPPGDIDVVLVAPKGSGTTLRRDFLAGAGMNASIAVHQDATGHAGERAEALGIAIGAGYLFETTFEKEVICDLTGERGTLLGAIYGLWLAQYETLREHGHSPAEAFNETVEEATQSLYPLIAEKGMDWMYAHCSTTAQRGALDWYRRFRDAVKPVFERLYASVSDGTETRRTLLANSRPEYREELQAQLNEIADSEMWRAGSAIRSLRSIPTQKNDAR
jgi:ketol-acid reductoisomerase